MHNATDRPRSGVGAWLALVSAAATLMVATPVHADADLAAKKLCMGCHRVDERRNGPSFRDIARRYAGQPDAVAALSRKVISGGRGAWGMVPMPANPQVSEAEARQLVQWILSQHR
jgi:cytochrome c